MEQKAARNVDSLYRNLKQLPLLGLLGIIIPIIGFLLLPITGAYLFLRSQLLRAIDSGQIALEEHDRLPIKQGELSTQQKVDFIRRASLVVPTVVGTFWLGAIVVFAIALSMQ